MNEDCVKLDSIIVKKAIKQLINSDGMEVKNEYLVRKHIYYIDNVEIIELLEKELIRHYYNKIRDKKGNVSPDELFGHYTPQYINYDKFYDELENEHSLSDEGQDDKKEYSLNRYF